MSKDSSVIPHWEDTLPGSLISVGVKMKIDLHLVAVEQRKTTDSVT